MQQRLRKIEQLNKRAAAKAKKSADLEQQLPEMQVTVSELRHICKAAGNENSHFSSNWTQCKWEFSSSSSMFGI